MDKKQKLKDIFLAIGAAIISLTLYKLVGYLITPLISSSIIQSFVSELCFALFALCFVFLLKRTDVFKTDSKFLRSGLTASGFMFVFYLVFGFFAIPMLLNTTASIAEIFAFIGFGFLVGFTEELLFRGLIQTAFHKYFGEDSLFHVWCALLCGGVIFGLAHISNAIRPGADVMSALVQTGGTMGMGIYLGTVYFRSHKNLWLVAILHALYDMVLMLGQGMLAGEQLNNLLNSYSANPLSALAWPTIYLVLCLFLLRPKKV